MDPIREIEEIRNGFADAETTAAEVRAAARVLERTVGLAGVLEALIGGDLSAVAIARGAEASSVERWAWLTLAAAGPERARRILAWRACRALELDYLADALLVARRPRRACRRLAGGEVGAEERVAWLLLASLRPRELRRIAAAHPVLSGRRRRAGGWASTGRSGARGKTAASSPCG